jgi:acyl transferase domain-containing protein/acyl-CoA synthetase (AMP-forming)/AMP-acid ligase II/acyl carrier protein
MSTAPETRFLTLADILRRRAATEPDRVVFTFLRDGDAEEQRSTFAELDASARSIAAALQRHRAAGERALILLPSGIPYIASFFGCLYAGVLPVPSYPPRRHGERVCLVADDCDAQFALTMRDQAAAAERALSETPAGQRVRVIAVDGLPAAAAADCTPVRASRDDLAFLQYTSGSTSEPKGVMVSHGNLIHNLSTRSFRGTPDSVLVTWLPLFHDMGLIAMVLHAVYDGMRCILMSPAAFVQQPFRWLRAISRYRGTASGAPNFAYELCLSRITPQQRNTLDLSSWSVAFNGAEPVRAETLEQFSRVFAPHGFRASALLPAYGLAEATVGVTVGANDALSSIQTVDALKLQRHEVAPATGNAIGRRFVSCGPTAGPDQDVAIVNAATGVRCGPDEVGEIWVKGPSVAQGYWGRPAETAATFGARLANGDGPYLRTGDLGFLRDRELFVTGRIKDLIVVRGWNHYPQDLELTALRSHASLRSDGSAAVGVDIDGEERAVIVQELAAGVDVENVSLLAEIIASVRRAVALEHELNLHAVVLVPARALPKTTSGKPQRTACRAAFLEKRLPVVSEWVDAARPDVIDASHAEAEALEDWLIKRIAAERRVPPETISPETLFADLGLDSAAVIALSGDLEKRLGRRIPPTVVFEFPCVRDLAHHLTGYHADDSAGRAAADESAALREPIAIIGMACRLPGAANPDAFWQLLESGREAIVPVPASRWRVDDYYDPDPAAPGKTSSELGGFLDQVDRFDPLFFGISPREAAYMDPQQRLLLELSWEALEDAGQVVDRLARTRTGVFVGISTTDYGQLQFEDPASIGAHSNTGCSPAIAANRISYVFDFRGPSLSIDTACSSSLAAVHLACRSLWSGEATMALAGGANVVLSPAATIGATKLMALAPDGRCKTFDASANGYVRGEGVGIVVLKPLRQALADHDPIHAVIRSTALNQDGRSNGLTAPNVAAQEALLREAYESAGIPPVRVDYVEAHGTGTFLGDPIEAQALGTVLSDGRPAERPCLIGSVKTNIGHLEAAAGIAGLVKTTLALRHGQIPASLHFVNPNPHIPFETLKLKVPRELTDWPAGATPRLAGVSSFGFGGTNVHVVLEDRPRIEQPTRRDRPAIETMLPLSARSPEALRSVARNIRDLLASTTDDALPLRDVCFTAAVRRSHHSHRLALVGTSRHEMCAALDAFERNESAPGLSVAAELRRSGLTEAACRRRGPVFVFSGQGSQWPEMARGLFHSEPAFRASILRCAEIMRGCVDWSLEEMIDTPGHPQANDVDVVQPLIFAVQVALVALLKARGVEPAAVVGHSMGETAAAFCAGALSLDDATLIVCRRSRRAKTARPGAMVLVDLPSDDVLAWIPAGEPIWIAASNSPRSTVLTGDPDALRELVARFDKAEIFSRWIAVEFAAHSPWVDEFASELTGDLATVRPHPASIAFYSSVTGDDATTVALDADYWTSNLRRPVLFASAVSRMLADGYDTFVEISPHPILAIAVQECTRAAGASAVVIPSLRRGYPERAAILECLAALYVNGHDLPFEHLFAVDDSTCVSLPAYPWQRQRCWMDRADSAGERRSRPSDGRDGFFIGHAIESSLHPDTRLWDVDADGLRATYASQHVVRDVAVLPAAAYIDMVARAAAQMTSGAGVTLEDVAFERPVVFEEDPQTFQLAIVDDGAGDAATFRFSSRRRNPQRDAWTAHASGRLMWSSAPPPMPRRDAVDDVRARCPRVVSAAEHCQTMADHGVIYGRGFQRLTDISRGRHEAIGRLTVSDSNDATGTFRIDAGIVDACLQIVGAAALADAQDDRALYVPSAIDAMWCSSLEHAGGDLWCHARVTPEIDDGVDTVRGDVVLTTGSGDVVLGARGVRLRAAGSLTRLHSDWLHELRWESLSSPDASTEGRRAGVWIVFDDESGIGGDLCRRIAAGGGRVVTVTAASRYAVEDVDQFEINPDSEDDYQRLLGHAAADDDRFVCSGIVYLWSLDSRGASDPASASFEICERALRAIQAFTRPDWTIAPRIWIVTRDAQPVEPDDRVAPIGSALWGLGRTLIHEHPEHRCTLIDIDQAASATEVGSMLAREIAHDSAEDQVAFRRRNRFVARLQPLNGGSHARAKPRPPLKADGTYIVTGGLGFLGRQCGRWLAERGARRILLIGRSDPSQAALDDIAAIARRGADVLVGRADVCDARQLATCLESFEDHRQPFRGVIHAAGILDDAPLRLLNARGLHGVMAPRVQGAWNLHQWSLRYPIDLFVLFSSAVAITGSPGQGNYASASAFMDGLAHARAAGGWPAVSINWGPWSGAGLASSSDRTAFLAAHGLTMIAPDHGRALLDSALDAGLTQVIVMKFDAHARRLRDTRLGQWPLLSHLVGSDGVRHERTTHALAGEARTALLALPRGISRTTSMETLLRDQIARVLRIPASQIDPQVPLRMLGLDSMMAVELRDRLEAMLGVTLSATIVWSYPTLERLAFNLLERIEPSPVVSPADVVPDLVSSGLSEDQLAALLSAELRELDERV